MASLQVVVQAFTSVLITEGQVPFMGKILPAGEGDIPNFLMSFPRLILRVPADAPVRAGDVVIDDFSRHLLVANYDAVTLAGTMLYRTHQLFQVDRLISWSRQISVVDALTGLEKSSGTETALGPIRATFEIAGREYPDRQSNAREESIRCITGAAVQLNDKVDGKIVKKIHSAFGIYVAEIQ